MAKPTAFTISIDPASLQSDETPHTSENNSVSQTSPAWVLTFVRWAIQDPLRTPSKDPVLARDPLVVENDCVDITVSSNKGSLTPSMSATLKITDVNYATAIHPGDFCFVNMLNFESIAREVANKANDTEPINEYEDGFKGIFKIQSVRKSLQVDPSTGTKILVVRVEGFAFTEFNNTIYFNPNLVNPKSTENFLLYIADITAGWANWVSKITNNTLQDILAFLIHGLIGSSFNTNAKIVAGLVFSPNEHFLVPPGVARLLGVIDDSKLDSTDYRAKATSAKDIYFYLFGIQQYSGAVDSKAVKRSVGLNPSNLKKIAEYPNFFYTTTPCQGKSVLKAEYWNQVKVWSILNQYTNSPLNELYTCFKLSADNGRVMPHVVFRQIPFSSDDFDQRKFGTPQDSNASSINITKYMSLPRWKIDPALVFNIDIGSDEAARINFVQYYARSNISSKGIDTSAETALKNYVFDKDDVQRNGLRPYVVQNQFADLTLSTTEEAPIWARILGDAVIGGQLKLNGTISCVGIVDPIAVGENVEFDNVVYHIEQVTHTCSINPNTGIKSFRTTLSLSHGVSVESSDSGTVYTHMQHVDAYGERTNDGNNTAILPGISESQDIIKRAKHKQIDLPDQEGTEIDKLPYAQPSLNKNKTGNNE